MSFPCPVPGCDRDATEWTLCRSCASRLAGDLAEVPALAAELEVTLARQGAQGGRGGSRTTTPPLAYDPRASSARDMLKATLVGWVLVLVEETGADRPTDTAAGCARWLLVRVGELRVHPAAGDIAAEIGAQVTACRRVIDLAPERHTCGPCDDCGAPMAARDGAITVWCPALGCRASYDVAERRARLLDAARDQLLTIPEMLRALPGLLGHELNGGTLQKWHQRGRMIPHGLTAGGRDTFRVGDVIDLLSERRAS